MANSKYDKAKNGLLLGTTGYGWVSQDIRVMLVDGAAYAPDTVNHASLSDVPAAARIAVTTIPLRSSDGAGAALAGDSKFAGVTGPTSEYLLIYRHTGTDSSSFLIALIDTAPNLPFTPNGGDLDINWSSSGIYVL